MAKLQQEYKKLSEDHKACQPAVKVATTKSAPSSPIQSPRSNNTVAARSQQIVAQFNTKSVSAPSLLAKNNNQANTSSPSKGAHGQNNSTPHKANSNANTPPKAQPKSSILYLLTL
jgi:hypothetical protein